MYLQCMFKYLGSIFVADDSETHDVKRRIALVETRMGELHNIFNSGIKFSTKMKIYGSKPKNVLVQPG